MIQRIFRDQTDDTLIQLIRYTFVGGFAFTVDFTSLYLLTSFIGIHYLVSAAIAFLLGLAINYKLCILWVFDKRSVKSKRTEFIIFSVVGLIGLGFNEIFLWLFTEILNYHYLYSKLLSALIVYMWNFFARKYSLFSVSVEDGCSPSL